MILRTIFIAFSLLLFISSHAQKFEYGLEAGFALSFFDKNEEPSGDPQYDGFEKAVRPAFEIDVPVDYWFSESFALSSGLNYTEKGGAFRIKNEDYAFVSSSGSGQSDAYNYLRYRLGYFELPVTAKIDLFNILNIGGDDQTLRLSSGIVPMLNVASKTRENSYEDNGSEVEQSWDSEKFDGAERFLTSWIVKVEWTGDQLIFYGSFAQNISDVYDTSVVGNENYDISMSTVSFGMGALLGK